MVHGLRLSALSALVGVALTCGSATAQLSTAFSYQGVLDDGGSPANGAYDFQFQLFDAEIGGAAVGPIVSSLNQAVTDGLIQQQPDFGSVFTGQRLWIEVRVRSAGSGAYSALPRREIVAAPNAQFAVRAAEATFAETSGTTLDEAINNGSDVDLGSDLISITDGVGTMFFGAGDDFGNNVLQFLGSTGDFAVYFAEDQDGGAGFMSVASDPAFFNGIFLDGDNNGTASPGLTMFGNAAILDLSMDQVGSASVALPTDAVESREILNEAGVAGVENANSPVVLTTTVQTVESATIVAPSVGFVLAIATVEVRADHQTGSDTTVTFGLSQSPAAFQSGLEYSLEIEASVATDPNIFRALSLHGLFDVTPGTQTIYLNGSGTDSSNRTSDITDVQMTLVFIPTAYGNVPRLPPELVGDDEMLVAAGARGPITPGEIAAEREAAMAANLARMEAEMAVMKAEMDAMRAERQQSQPVN
ncbi:MAG: hypothetical protein AAGI53_00835 [Planctomycetota bacterium]